MSASNQPRDIFSGITDWFSCICEPQACGPRAAFDEHEPASNAPLRVDDERFAIMASDDGIQQSFKAYSSTSAKGRAIERGNFPAFCRHFFTRIDPTYTLTSEDMNLLWEFFDRQREGRLDIFQFGVAVKQLLQNRAGKRGLIMVDFQKDFVDGSLKVAEGIDAVRQANMVRDKFDKDLIWLTRDWHPPDHMSFHDNNNADVMSIKTVRLPNGESSEQVMWPRHCVAGSAGAEWCPALVVRDTDTIIDKGLDPKVDSYSGFLDNCKGYETKLKADLLARGVSEVYIVGLAYDYCVGYTALDAKAFGFNVYVVDDCTRAVSQQSKQAMDERLSEERVMRIQSSHVPLPLTTNGTHLMSVVRKLVKPPHTNGA